MPATPEHARPAVLARYPAAATAGVSWAPLGGGGGFSGASVWRGDGPGGRPVLALKAWAPGGVTSGRLAAVHALVRRAADLAFVPGVIATRDTSTVVVEGGRVWEMAQWAPGVADFHARPTAARLAAACAAVALVHRAWAPISPTFAPCPGVRRRLRVLADFDAARGVIARPAALGHAGLDGAARRAADAVARAAAATRARLIPWENRPVEVRPCVCDVWHDHVLFTGDAVTGLIDFGAAKDDHPAVDLARLLGDLVGDHDARFAAGIDAYRAAGGSPGVTAGFARFLDRTGVVCSAAVWLLRLLVEHRICPDPAAVAARLDRLTARIPARPSLFPSGHDPG